MRAPAAVVSNFLKKVENVVDSTLPRWHNNRCCLEVRHYLSWIEGLTTNQYAGGSNPSWRTISAVLFRNDWATNTCGFFIVGGKART